MQRAFRAPSTDTAWDEPSWFLLRTGSADVAVAVYTQWPSHPFSGSQPWPERELSPLEGSEADVFQLSLWTKGRQNLFIFMSKDASQVLSVVQNWRTIRGLVSNFVQFAFTRSMGLWHSWQAGVNFPELIFFLRDSLWASTHHIYISGPPGWGLGIQSHGARLANGSVFLQPN